MTTRRGGTTLVTIMVTALLETICGEHAEARRQLRSLDTQLLTQFQRDVQRLDLTVSRVLSERRVDQVDQL